jgi:hypothetical protein
VAKRLQLLDDAKVAAKIVSAPFEKKQKSPKSPVTRSESSSSHAETKQRYPKSPVVRSKSSSSRVLVLNEDVDDEQKATGPPGGNASHSSHDIEQADESEDDIEEVAKTLSTISDTSAEVSVGVKRSVGTLLLIHPKCALASGPNIEGSWDCYWNDVGFDPMLRTIIREYLGLYWSVERAPRSIRAEDYNGARIPVNSYADLLRTGGWGKRALETVNTWPKPVTFSRAELMSRARSDSVSSSRQIKKFCDTYERFIAPTNLGKYLDVTHGLLLPTNLPSSWEEFVTDDVKFLHHYANHTRKGIMGNLRRDWKKFLETTSYLVRQKIL